MKKELIVLIILILFILFLSYNLFGEENNSKELIKRINKYRKLADKKIEKAFKYCSIFNNDSNKIISLIGEYKLIFSIELNLISRAKANSVDLGENFYKIERSTRKNIEALNILLNIAPENAHALLSEALNLTQKGRINLITYFSRLNSSKENDSFKTINLKEILREGGDKW